MSLKVSRILHAGYLLECDDFKIAFDPLFENPFSHNCYAYPAVEFTTAAIQDLKLDAVFISHYHDDHFSMESLNLLHRDTPIYMYSVFEELIELIKDLGFKTVHSIELLRPVKLGPFEILPLEALDADVDSIYHIKAQGKNILNVVDSWIGPRTMPRLLSIPWDLVLWPMQSMREIEVISPASAAPISEETLQIPSELLEQLTQLKPRALIPSACQFKFEEMSWYNHAFFPITYKQFEKQVSNALPKTQILRLNPGQSLQFTESDLIRGEALPWILPQEDQNGDYEFKPELVPPSMSIIAKQLPGLDLEQKKRVQSFCESEIIQRFDGLSVSEDSAFLFPQTWRLLIYGKNGLSTPYQYHIHHNTMTKASLSDAPTWTTEISESKIFGALEEGESLTSIYIRVTNPKDSDPLEDPLIRSLYEGIIGGYQKAQLKKMGFRVRKTPDL